MGFDFKASFWDEGTPSGTSDVRQIDEEFVSLKSSLRSIIGDEHEFNTAAADHVRGTHKQGSARVYLDAESNLSVSGTSYVGRLYAASDTSRLFVVPSSGYTMFVGGSLIPEVAAYGSDTTATAHYPGQNARWVIQTGYETLVGGLATAEFNPLYSNPPRVFCSYHTTNTGIGASPAFAWAASVGTQYAYLQVAYYDGTATAPGTVNWVSIGTVDF